MNILQNWISLVFSVTLSSEIIICWFSAQLLILLKYYCSIKKKRFLLKMLNTVFVYKIFLWKVFSGFSKEQEAQNNSISMKYSLYYNPKHIYCNLARVNSTKINVLYWVWPQSLNIVSYFLENYSRMVISSLNNYTTIKRLQKTGL